MNKRINERSVVWMARTGFAPCAIARRLKCSDKQVRRILAKWDCPPAGTLKGFDREHQLWHVYKYVWFETDSLIALRFGVSKQAVHQYFASKGKSIHLLKNQNSHLTPKLL